MSAGAFAVQFKDLKKWSPASFFSADWKWPAHVIEPIETIIKRKIISVDKATASLTSENFITLRFGGAIEPRDMDGDPTLKGSLFWAESGDLIYSKIDCRNGAIGIVPKEYKRVAVTSEFPVYNIQTDKAIPEYVFLLFQTRHFLDLINGMVSGASGRKRVQPQELEGIRVPIPGKDVQRAIVDYWHVAESALIAARSELIAISNELDVWLLEQTELEVFDRPWLALEWRTIGRWDSHSARAAAFSIAHPDFVPFSTYAEEITELVNPRSEPEHQWPVYGVNNKEGVFFSHRQAGKDFNSNYKKIREGWFFHNPTRAVVGSLGYVPKVPIDALTSPEYQIWRLRDIGTQSLSVGFVSVLLRTQWFLKVIQFHRVGAVKQRLYVENLLKIPVPQFPALLQKKIEKTYKESMHELAVAERRASVVKQEIEAMIVGIRPPPT